MSGTPCAEKVRYLTRAYARQAVGRSHSRGRKKTHPYHCPTCGYWHLTSADAESRAYHRAADRKAKGDES